MVFSSAAFLFAFLPITLLLYFIPIFKQNSDLDIKRKNIVMCLCSLVFYAWGEPIYILLMLISILFNYAVGLDIDYNSDKPKLKKAILIFGIVFNVFLLGFFKYSDFFVSNINSIFSLDIKFKAPGLPLGISFYTFQILSYIIDVYKGTVKAQPKLFTFAGYIAMFPQLISGPIVPYRIVEPQLAKREITAEKFYEGILLFVRGMGKKLLFVGTIETVYTDIIAGNIKEISVVTAWVGILSYSLQLYFDFSGYSDMAIGLGKMFGFDFPKNFNFPYMATSITDFWRRWHISLSTWFRDYIYIPLGGNRRGTPRAIFNILVVWSLTGLWHGASWTFIAWGALYGVLLIVEKYVLGARLEKIPVVLRYIGTMLVVAVGWVFFSSPTIGSAGEYILSMLGFYGNSFIDTPAMYTLSTVGFPIFVMSLSAGGVFDRVFSSYNGKWSRIIRGSFYVIVFVLCIVYLISSTYNSFLYFKF